MFGCVSLCRVTRLCRSVQLYRTRVRIYLCVKTECFYESQSVSRYLGSPCLRRGLSVPGPRVWIYTYLCVSRDVFQCPSGYRCWIRPGRDVGSDRRPLSHNRGLPLRHGRHWSNLSAPTGQGSAPSTRHLRSQTRRTPTDTRVATPDGFGQTWTRTEGRDHLTPPRTSITRPGRWGTGYGVRDPGSQFPNRTKLCSHPFRVDTPMCMSECLVLRLSDPWSRFFSLGLPQCIDSRNLSTFPLIPRSFCISTRDEDSFRQCIDIRVGAPLPDPTSGSCPGR